MSKLLNKILKPILMLVPDMVYYVDPREQALSEETDKLRKGVLRQVIDRAIILGVVLGLFLGSPIIKILCLAAVFIELVLYFKSED